MMRGGEPASSIPPELTDGLLIEGQRLSSVWKTFVNLILCIVGTGVLGLPYSFSTVGWALGVLTIASSAIIVYNGMMLQIRCKRILRRSRGEDVFIASYGDLMFHAFGLYGRLAVDILLTLSTFAAGISYISFMSQSFASIASSVKGMQASNPAVLTSSEVYEGSCHGYVWSGLDLSWLSASTYTWFIFPVEVALAAIPSVTLLAPFSAVGDAVSFTALASLMVSDVVEIKSTFGFLNMKPVVRLAAVPSAFGVGVYAFQSSGIMIPIEAAMQEPLKFGMVLGVAFVLSGAVYTIFGVLGYAAYGENTQQVITLNLSNGTEATVVKVVISFSLLLAFPLVLNPMFELVERRFAKRKISWVLRTSIVFTICLVATVVKRFVDFLSLAGSSISCLVGFILPAAVHIKVMKEYAQDRTSAIIYAGDYFLIIFGLMFGAFGTVVSFLEFF